MGLIPLSPTLLWWRRIASDNWGQQFVTVTCMKSLNLIMVKIANVLISSLNGNTKGHRTCEKHFVEQWHLITFGDTACSGWWKDEHSLLLVRPSWFCGTSHHSFSPRLGRAACRRGTSGCLHLHVLASGHGHQSSIPIPAMALQHCLILARPLISTSYFVHLPGGKRFCCKGLLAAQGSVKRARQRERWVAFAGNWKRVRNRNGI